MKDYLKYLNEVLGVQGALLNSDQQAESIAMENGTEVFSENLQDVFFTKSGPFKPTTFQHFEVVFLNILTQSKESYFSPEVFELASKMKNAMKLRNVQTIELDCLIHDRSVLPSKLAELCEARIVVVYSSFPKDLSELIFKGPGKWIETYSPAYLLEDPAAKKIVWGDLQKVMRELGIL